jgi:hypothetical protein
MIPEYGTTLLKIELPVTDIPHNMKHAIIISLRYLILINITLLHKMLSYSSQKTESLGLQITFRVFPKSGYYVHQFSDFGNTLLAEVFHA